MKQFDLDQMVKRIWEDGARQQEEQRQLALARNEFYARLRSEGVDIEKLPMKARHILWLGDAGIPVHPKDAVYVKGEIAELQRGKA